MDDTCSQDSGNGIHADETFRSCGSDSVHIPERRSSMRRLLGNIFRKSKSSRGDSQVFDKSPVRQCSREDWCIADVVSFESTEDEIRCGLEHEEEHRYFQIRSSFLQGISTVKAQTVWDGTSPLVTHRQFLSMFDAYFRMMRTRMRQSFHVAFPYGIVNSNISEEDVASLVGALVLIDIATMDDDPHSLPFPLVPGHRVSIANCPPEKLHTYFSFMAFKFSGVRRDPEGFQRCVVKHHYHSLKKNDASAFALPLRALLVAMQPISLNALFNMHVPAFYRDAIKLEEELVVGDGTVINPNADQWTTINFQFQRGDLIGSGASGQVFRCYRVPGDKMFALKVLSFASTTGGTHSSKEDMIRGEINMLKRLKDKRVISYYGCYFDRPMKEFGIMMEYAPQTLRTRIDETRGVMIHTIAHLAVQILQGLEYLHDNHIIHQDIKAANILLSSRGRVKIGDLGTATLIEASTSGGDRRVNGTPLFMAPEVARDCRPSEASDIWSFGCVLIELATGGMPWPEFAGLGPMQIMYKVGTCTSPPSLPPTCGLSSNALFVDFLSSCLHLDPCQRPSASTLLSHTFLKETIDEAASSLHTGGVSRSTTFSAGDFEYDTLQNYSSDDD